MASNWYHSFEAQMSWEVVGVVIVLMALAYLIGRKSIQYVSVKKACKIKGEFVAPKSAPQYEAGKENGVDRRIKDRVLKVASRKELKANSTVMVLHSTTFDNAIAAVFASIFAYVFANAHINGMIQWFINHLGANESAAWGDICAFMAILEAVKFKMITIFQNKLFGDIKICAREDNTGYVPSEEELTSN